MSGGAAVNGWIVFYMALNFWTSVLIVWANKLAFQTGFRWTVTLTALHFLFTYIGLEISASFGLFERKKLPVTGVLPICAAFCGFVVFNNLSLQFNSVGLYQLLKVLTTPTILVLEYGMYGKTMPWAQVLSLTPVCVGVVLASVSSVEGNFWGAVYGIAGILSTSLYQIWVKKQQEALKCSSPQLLYYQAPLSMCLLLFVIPWMEPLVDPDEGLLYANFTPAMLFWVFASAALAFLVNLSIFLVIGKTSPISYNVLGHGKLVCILISGVLLFGDSVNPRNILGAAMTLVGIFWYTHLKLQAPAAPKQAQGQYTPVPTVPKTDAESARALECMADEGKGRDLELGVKG